MKLSQNQLNHFEKHGFLLIRDLYEKKDMKKITQWTDEVTNYPEVPNKYMMYFEESKLEKGKRILSRMEDI